MSHFWCGAMSDAPPPSPYSRDDHRCSKSLAGGVPITESAGLRAVREECMKTTGHGRFLSLHSQFLSFLPLMRGEWGKIMSEGQLSALSSNLIRTEFILSKETFQPWPTTDNYSSWNTTEWLFWTQLYTVSNVKISRYCVDAIILLLDFVETLWVGTSKSRGWLADLGLDAFVVGYSCSELLSSKSGLASSSKSCSKSADDITSSFAYLWNNQASIEA